MGNRIKILLVLIACAASFPGSVFAQKQTVTLSSSEISVRDAFREIEEQTSYRFALGHSGFDLSRVAKLDGSKGSVSNILGSLLKGSGRTFRIDNDSQILVIPERIKPQEEKKMVVVKFDWSKSYSDEDFIRDLEDSARTNQSRPSKVYEPFTEVTLIPDSVFHYAPYTLLHDLNEGQWQRPDNRPANHFALKTNVLYGAVALAANLSAEIGITRKTTLELAYGVNMWNKYNKENRKKIHWYVRPEFRYWTCNRFEGHFFGIHGFYWQYNVSGHYVPGMFEKKYQYEGNAFGAGITYGYSQPLSKHWGLEFSLGIGVAFMKYDKFECARCGDFVSNYNKTYFGPTGLGVKLVYLIK